MTEKTERNKQWAWQLTHGESLRTLAKKYSVHYTTVQKAVRKYRILKPDLTKTADEHI